MRRRFAASDYAKAPHGPGHHRVRGRAAQERGGLIDGQVYGVNRQAPRVLEGGHLHGDHCPVGGGSCVLAGGIRGCQPRRIWRSTSVCNCCVVTPRWATSGPERPPDPHPHPGEPAERRPGWRIVQGPAQPPWRHDRGPTIKDERRYGAAGREPARPHGEGDARTSVAPLVLRVSLAPADSAPPWCARGECAHFPDPPRGRPAGWVSLWAGPCRAFYTVSSEPSTGTRSARTGSSPSAWKAVLWDSPDDAIGLCGARARDLAEEQPPAPPLPGARRSRTRRGRHRGSGASPRWAP